VLHAAWSGVTSALVMEDYSVMAADDDRDDHRATGRLGAFGLWTDLRAWRQRVTPDGCPICQSIRSTGQPQDTLVALDASWVTAPRRAPLPGYVCLVSRRHVIEPYQLPEPEQRAFFAEAMRTARAVAELLRPIRVNYEIHGNSIPHLHLHIYPRYSDDPFVGGPIDLRNLPFRRNDQQLAALRDAIRGADTHR
jgi:diadenosine tetraphosphate (Ap4A) HIT family hydrolase